MGNWSYRWAVKWKTDKGELWIYKQKWWMQCERCLAKSTRWEHHGSWRPFPEIGPGQGIMDTDCRSLSGPMTMSGWGQSEKASQVWRKEAKDGFKWVLGQVDIMSWRQGWEAKLKLKLSPGRGRWIPATLVKDDPSCKVLQAFQWCCLLMCSSPTPHHNNQIT